MVPASHEHISKDPHVLLLLIKAQSTLVLSKVQCVIFSEHFKPIAPVFEIDFWQLALLEVRAWKDIAPAFVHKVYDYSFKDVALQNFDISLGSYDAARSRVSDCGSWIEWPNLCGVAKSKCCQVVCPEVPPVLVVHDG
jgi:hypothetical protein